MIEVTSLTERNVDRRAAKCQQEFQLFNTYTFHFKAIPCIATVRVLNFVGKIFVFLVGNKIRGVLIFVAMVEW